MRRLSYSILASTIFLLGGTSVKADWDFWGYKLGNKGQTELYTIDSSTGVSTLVSTFCKDWTNPDLQIPWCEGDGSISINETTGNPIIEIGDTDYSYDLDSNSWSSENNSSNNDWSGGFTDTFSRKKIIEDSDGTVAIGIGTKSIKVDADSIASGDITLVQKNQDGSIQIGTDLNDVDITAEGLTVDGISLITKKESGEIHIGKNSLITVEEDGVQKLYAKDESENAINIDITNGSKLLIDGVEVTAGTGGDSEQVTTNKNNITTNSSGISTNAANITNNTSNITTNSSGISTNAANITNNTSNITTNSSGISTNAANITTNTSNITTNESGISSNAANITTNTSNISSNAADLVTLNGLIGNQASSSTTTKIGSETKNTLEIGGDTNPTTIDQEGISVGGSNLIKKTSTGDIHIGKNSFVIGDDVVNGAHPIWAEDETGSKIPLNISGSDLQINGVSVQGQIDTNKTNITSNKNNINRLGEGVANSTALTAALTALPQASTDSKLSCGVGTGAYSSSYALGVGCASKVNERVDVNFGGSYVGGGSKDYGSGSLDTIAAKAGFIFKLGKITKPTLISMKEKKELKTEVKNLKSTNQELKNLLALQNQRLEKLEQIALGHFNSNELVSSLQ